MMMNLAVKSRIWQISVFKRQKDMNQKMPQGREKDKKLGDSLGNSSNDP